MTLDFVSFDLPQLVPPEQLPVWMPPWGPWVVIAALAVVLLFVIARLATRQKAPPAGREAKTLPVEELLRPKVELPPSQAEAQKLREADQARTAAQELAQKRNELNRAQKEAADSAERDRLAAEAQAVKAREEEAKREAYRAEKAAEREAKDRHKREQEESVRLEEEAKERARQEEEARRAAAAEEERKKVQAQAGQTLAQGLDRTKTQGFIGKLNSFFSEPKAVDESVLGQLEEILFTADIGVKTASSLVELAREKVRKNELANADKIKAVIRKEVERIVDLPLPPSIQGASKPHVVMVVGVNGAGKTTTIGKLAAKSTAQGKKVLLAAGDTFRAAATEQLDIWAERAKAELVKGPENGDPSSVIFDALKKAQAEGVDLVIADTAGRLHTKAPLMEELKKVKRVMDKALPGAPHEVLLVLDSTNGQNAIAQAKQFHEAVGVTSIALTKLDGTAKGGVVIGICDELKLPVVWAGVGEKVEDLRRFDPKEFVAALFD
ncbi:MAG: signal recognition particle-docking protein FtsY [Myxococcaceae bacterium]